MDGVLRKRTDRTWEGTLHGYRVQVFDAIAAIGRGVPVLGAAFQLAAATLQRAARAISRLERAAR